MPGSYGVFGEVEVPLGLGMLRLAGDARPPESDAIALIHRAFDKGIRILDTADSYCLSDSEFHFGEKLARRAVESWGGDRESIRIVTKVGMVRPKGRWVPNGRPAHLRKAVEGSLRALGTEAIWMLMLHGVDPACPFEETLSALAALQRAGKVIHLGLCNVDVAEIRQAQRHFPVAAIQNELSVQNRKTAADGSLEMARQLGIPFLAHRPFGGHAKAANLGKNRAMKPIAAAHGISPFQAALATLLGAGWPVVPLLGVTRAETLDAALRAAAMVLTDTDRAALAGKICFETASDSRVFLRPPETPAGLRALAPGTEPGNEPEVVLIMGVQGAGKSTLVQRYVEAGYARLNRDEAGGKLEDLVPRLEELLAAGERRAVLDNTYPTRASRFAVVRAAHAHGVPVRCVFVATPVREALANVVHRLLDRYGRLPGPEDLKEWSKSDPNLPPPAALARWAACFEHPQPDEGFGSVDVVPFVRRAPSPPHTAKGLLLDVDGTLRRTLSGEPYPSDPADIELLPRRREVLARFVAQGYTLFFVSNQSGIASGKISAEAVEACFARTAELLGLPGARWACCPHPAFPVGCFCRKPLPGLGIQLIRDYRLDAEHLIMVGDQDSDSEFAASIGARYHPAEDFFA